jgi:hypothetical protein
LFCISITKQLMMTRSILLIAILFLAGQSFSQSVLSYGLKVGTSSETETPYGSCETSDGGIAVTGERNDSTFVTKIDTVGAVEWTVTLDIIGTRDAGMAIVQSDDGGFMVLVAHDSSEFGNNFPNFHYGAVGKIDANGNMLWLKTIDATLGNPLLFFDIIALGNDTYLVGCSYSESVGAVYGMAVFTIDGNQNMSNMHYYYDGNTAPLARFQDVTKTTDGGYAIAASNGFFREAVLLKLDANFNILWAYEGDGSGEFPFGVVENAAGNYMYAFYDGSGRIYLEEFDPSGNHIDQLILNSNTTIDFVRDIIYKSGGEYIITGITDANEAFMITANTANRSAFYRTYSNTEDFISARNDASNGLFLVGKASTGYFNLFHTDITGSSSCDDEFGFFIESTSVTQNYNIWSPTHDSIALVLGSDLSSSAFLNFNSNALCGAQVLEGSGLDQNYQVAINESNDDEVLAGCLGKDFGATLAGVTNSIGAGDNDAYVVHLDLDGEISWTRSYGTSEEDRILDIISTSDGGYLHSGYTKINGDKQMLVFKTNSLGQVSWSKVMNTISGVEELNAAVENGSGNFLLVGTGYRSGGTSNEDIVVIEINSNGAVQWSNYYGGADREEGHKIIQTSDGGYAIAGHTRTYDHADGDALILKISSTGAHQWTKIVGQNSTITREYGYDIIESSDGGYLFTGYAQEGSGFDYKQYIVKLDNLQNVEFSKSFGYNVNSAKGSSYSVYEDFNGNFIVSGEFNKFPSSNPDEEFLSILSLDATGSINWANKYGLGEEQGGYMFVNPIDLGYYLAGTTVGINGTNDIYVVKTDSLGNAKNCHYYPITGNVLKNLTLVESSATPDVTSYSFSSSNISLTVSVGNANLIDLNLELDYLKEDISCFGSNDGSVQLGASGGSTPYNYTWDDNVLATANRTNMSDGDYVANVLDAFGCIVTDTITIEEPTQLSSTIVGTNVSCNGGSDGLAWVVGSGGTAPYTYFWNNGVSNDTISGLTPGNYTVNIFDANSCVNSNIITIDEPAMFGYTVSSSDNGCFGASNGSISVSGQDGTQAYSISWTDGNTDFNRTNLSAGTYIFTVSDNCGASYTDSVQVGQPDTLAGSLTINNISCNGANDGSVQTQITGGTAPYSYLWHTNNSTTTNINNLSPGLDSVSITDACGINITLYYTISEPSILLAQAFSTDASCFGSGDGSAYVTLTGGTAPFVYVWNTGHNIDSVQGLFAASYSVNITDANGCFANAFVSVGQASQLNYTSSIIEPSCGTSNGNIEIIPSGGTGTYTINWLNSGNTGTLESNLSSGTYSFEIIDGNGCSLTDSITLGTGVNAVELCVITVDTQSDKNTLVWEKPLDPGISGFNIYRNISGAYSLIDFWPYDSISEYVDETFGVNPNITSYRYKISVMDSCGNESLLSDFHETIHLTSNQGINDEINLIWDNYEGFGFNWYYILRDSTDQDNWEVIDSVSNFSFTYTDFNVPSDSVRYMIEVQMPQQCTSTRANNHNTSRSNKNTPTGAADGILENYQDFIQIYPNPADDFVQISWERSIPDPKTANIFDINGRLVYSNESIIGGSGNYLSIDLDNFAKGMYFLHIHVGENKVVKRLIVE